MKIAKTKEEARQLVSEYRGEGARISFVPTMGALHDGHISLVTTARKQSTVTVASVFVNPLQFGPNEDFARYPRDIVSDLERLEAAGADIAFTPATDEMYGESRGITIAPPAFAGVLEGAVRPGHFAGMLTVVAKLLNIVAPDVAIFGRKDLQQLALIRAMTHDLDFPVEIVGAETVRETDGLAMSSRNRYLVPQDRARATLLSRALEASRKLFTSGERDSDAIEAEGRAVLDSDAAISVDYFAVVRESDFERPKKASGGDSVVTAARIGATRLIDNMRL